MNDNTLTYDSTVGEISLNINKIQRITYEVEPILYAHLDKYFDKNLREIHYIILELMKIKEEDLVVLFLNRIASIKNSLNFCSILKELLEREYNLLQDNLNQLFDIAIECDGPYFYSITT